MRPEDTALASGEDTEKESAVKFWMVMRHDGRNPPQVRHASREAAEAEAQRLAIKERTMFFVMESVDCFEVLPVEAVRVPFVQS